MENCVSDGFWERREENEPANLWSAIGAIITKNKNRLALDDLRSNLGTTSDDFADMFEPF